MSKQREEDLDTSLSGDENASGQAGEQRTKWYKRIRKGITTELRENLFVCPKCNYHHRIGSEDYYEIVFDNKEYKELFDNITSKDFLGFTDLKPYQKRLDEIHDKTDLKDSMRVAVGKIGDHEIVVACMDFEFIGGSLGSVMGEKFSRAIDYCLEHKLPYLVISKSGGARMMESAFSLMQLAKTSGKLAQLSDARIPYISLLTDPTFGGISASFGMLGDLNIAEPGALIGFAGPRVIKETIKPDLKPGFQRSEFILEHGFLDFIIDRKKLKERITQLLCLFQH